ncbi:DUF6510 family protein [Geodermatophilus sp. SYSU D01036]
MDLSEHPPDGTGAVPPAADERRLDGNAAAGVLAEVLTAEATAAVSTCTYCGGRAPLGAHLVYADAPALVLRCPTCMRVVLRCGSDASGTRLEMSGIRLLWWSPEPAGGTGTGTGAAST